MNDDGSTDTISYTRSLLEEKLGRKLRDNEEVHHIDGNHDNNSIDNLIAISKKYHRKYHAELNKKYRTRLTTCEVCGNKFVWTDKQQSLYSRDLNRTIKRDRIISCSRHCSTLYGMRLSNLDYKHDMLDPVYDEDGKMIIAFKPSNYY